MRIRTTDSNALFNVTFKTPDDKIILLVLNNTKTTEKFNMRLNKKSTTTYLKSGSVSTYI